MAGQPRGRIVWYENLSHDTKKTLDFYTGLIGWGVQAVPGTGGQTYHMFTKGETPIGGTLQMPDEAKKMGVPSHWLMYVGTADVDATVKQAQGLGARVHVPPTDIPQMGRFSVLQDPQGAFFALWKSGEGQPAPGEPTKPVAGLFSWHELLTTDPDKGFDFYQKLFGWEKRETHDLGEMGSYTEWSSPGTPFMLGGLMKKPKEMPVSAWILYIMVADINKSAEQAKKLGGMIVMGPMEVPGGDWVAQGMDTNGAFFALHQKKA